MTDHSDLKWNNDEIAGHLRSAVEALTPDVLSRIDFTTPQEIYAGPSKTVRLYRRMRTAALAAAACLALAVVSGLPEPESGFRDRDRREPQHRAVREPEG